MNSLNAIISAVNSTLTVMQVDKVVNRVRASQDADKGQGRKGKETVRVGAAKITLPKKGTLEQKAKWTKSTGESWEAPVTPGLKLESALVAWEDGVKRGLFDGSTVPPVHPDVRAWLERLITKVITP